MLSAYYYGHSRDGSINTGPRGTTRFPHSEGNTTGLRPAKTVYFMANSADAEKNAPVFTKLETKAVYDPAWDGRIDIVFQNGVQVVTTQVETAPILEDRRGSPIQTASPPALSRREPDKFP
jgi:hypothetical protein